eukprot:7687920-Pyramimonas_sp.AAC.1
MTLQSIGRSTSPAACIQRSLVAPRLERTTDKTTCKVFPARVSSEPLMGTLIDGPIGRRTHGYILTTDQSDAGCA